MEAKQGKSKTGVVIAVDPGSSRSGVVVLINEKIHLAKHALNEEIIPLVREYLGVKYTLRVVIEDVKPYKMRISQDIITTCKFIGVLEDRLKAARISTTLISRPEAKEWAYLGYNDLLTNMVKKKVLRWAKKEGLPPTNEDGSERQGNFVWLDNRMIESAMRLEWNIPSKRGTTNEYKLETHSFQALLLATLFIKGYVSELRERRKKRIVEAKKKKDRKKKKSASLKLKKGGQCVLFE